MQDDDLKHLQLMAATILGNSVQGPLVYKESYEQEIAYALETAKAIIEKSKKYEDT